MAKKSPQTPKTKPLRTKPVVMLIEDDGLILRMYQKKMELDGYEVIVALNGKEAIEKLPSTFPDIILCDVMMPEMNGFEVLAKVKADPDLKSIPVIMLTNLSSEEEALRAIEMGATTYLIKSDVLPADVVAKIKEILQASGSHQIPTGVSVNLKAA